MFGILNSAFRVATRTETQPERKAAPQQRDRRSTLPWFDDAPVSARSGRLPGESWSDRF
ncbi:hypothetical protein JI664_16350 [Rhodobacter sp. NTK016B]|uniref:hypothetical protein n=1 Tax=Rhodobacter sp. NTK016B TaxID=2759676 RepID=UPI001A8F3CCE|nr:hypothetical protein [Rhodobacter sp. NTK016B]MBN8293544.1 hypothetical protein [Rhodobacter sp. NTK016B]